MAYDIGPKIGMDGEAEFRKQLTNINASLKTLDTELKKVASEFQDNAESQDALISKNKVLAKTLETEKNKIDEVKKALENAKKNYGENSTQAQKWQQVLNRSEIAINNLNAEIRKNDQALEEIANGFRDAATGAKILNNSLDKVDDSKLTKAANTADSLSDKLSGVSKAAAGLGAAMLGTVPATQELRRDMSFLEENSKRVGNSMRSTEKAFKVFNSTSGETDSSIEGVSNLLQAGFTESNLEKAVKGLAGAAIRFPDTLKVESLADSLQETLATGKSIGQFSELLDRVGIGAENFDAKLAKCNTTAEKQDLILRTLAEAGLNDTYKEWVKNNKELTDYENAIIDMQLALSEFAKTAAPLVTTIAKAGTKTVETFNKLPKPIKIATGLIISLIAAASPLLKIFGNLGFALDGASAAGAALGAKIAGIGTMLGAISGPIIAVTAGIAALIAIFATLWKTNEKFRNDIKNLWEEIKGVFQSIFEQIKSMFSSFAEFVNVIWANWGDSIITIVHSVIASIVPYIEAGLNVIKYTIELVTAALNGDWNGAWEAAGNIVKSIGQLIVLIITNAFNAIVRTIVNIGSKISLAIINSFQSGINFITSLPGKALTWGKDFIQGFIDGILSRLRNLTKTIRSVANEIRSYLHFSRPDVGPLRDYETWMPDFMSGLAKGINDNIHLVKGAINNAALSMDFNKTFGKTELTAQAHFSAGLDYEKLASLINNNGIYLEGRLVGRAMKEAGVVIG